MGGRWVVYDVVDGVVGGVVDGIVKFVDGCGSSMVAFIITLF